MIQYMPLGDICTDIIDCPHESPEWKEDGIAVIRNFNLVNGQIDMRDGYFVDEETFKRRTRRAIPSEGDIIFSREAPIGNCAIVPPQFKCCLGQRLVLLRVNHNVCTSEYLLSVLQSAYVKKQIEQVSKQGSTVSNFAIGDLHKLVIPVLDNQDDVATFDDTVSRKLSNNNAICADLEAMAKLLYDYWFVQFDFPDENGKPYKSSGGKMVWNEDLKREIPEGWEVKPFGDVFSFVKGRIPDYLSNALDGDYTSPYITIDVANNGLPQYCNPKSMVECNGEVIMVMDGAASGDVYLGNIGSLGSTFSMLPSKRADISNALIYMLLKANMAVYKRANTGSTVPHANRSFIEKMKVCLPANASYVSNDFNLLFSKMFLAREENQQLASLRDFLLPMLMNGQVKVGDKGDLPPVAYPTDETRGEYMVAAEPKAEFKQNAGK